MILNIKSIRMAGLVDVFVRKINDKFGVEIEASQKYRLFYSILFGFGKTSITILLASSCLTVQNSQHAQ